MPGFWKNVHEPIRKVLGRGWQDSPESGRLLAKLYQFQKIMAAPSSLNLARAESAPQDASPSIFAEWARRIGEAVRAVFQKIGEMLGCWQDARKGLETKCVQRALEGLDQADARQQLDYFYQFFNQEQRERIFRLIGGSLPPPPRGWWPMASEATVEAQVRAGERAVYQDPGRVVGYLRRRLEELSRD
jgi:hypothetical protein